MFLNCQKLCIEYCTVYSNIQMFSFVLGTSRTKFSLMKLDETRLNTKATQEGFGLKLRLCNFWIGDSCRILYSIDSYVCSEMFPLPLGA